VAVGGTAEGPEMTEARRGALVGPVLVGPVPIRQARVEVARVGPAHRERPVPPVGVESGRDGSSDGAEPAVIETVRRPGGARRTRAWAESRWRVVRPSGSS
jgi:hypothetical protein